MLATEAMMAALTIRNVPDDVRDKLRARAEKNGRSMEAEVRAILAAACAEQPKTSALSLPDWVDQLYGGKKPKNVTDELIAERRREARREEEEYRRK
jgi:Antitoxin FitA-like, ribbon-helix-helix